MAENSQNEELILTFKNSHDAIAAEQALLGAGVMARVMPLPAHIAAGCGICLRVDPQARGAALAALENAGVGVTGVYNRAF